MRRSLFALLRGPDGRSLARALAALLFLGAVIGQLPGGLHGAAAAGGPVLCSASANSSAPGAPAGNDFAPCCLALCAGSLAPVVVSPAPALADVPASAAPVLQPLLSETTSADFAALPFGPRGPPVPA
jgi:hypothetical protein